MIYVVSDLFVQKIKGESICLVLDNILMGGTYPEQLTARNTVYTLFLFICLAF